MATPYITPDILINAPTGISWETIPNYDSTLTEQLAEQTNICWRASHFIDTYCNQPLRSTLDTEEVLGPNYRMTIDQHGLVRVISSRWPVTEIVSLQYAASFAVPPTWQTIPVTSSYIEASSAVDGGVSTIAAAGPSAILIAPGYISWAAGRRGYRLQMTYNNGYPHAGITANVSSGASTITVDDTTGVVGRYMTVYDGASTETVRVASASTTTGSGTITLTSPTVFAHAASIQRPLIISTLPAVVQQAAIFYATYITMTRGVTATTVQSIGGGVSSGGGSKEMLEDCKSILDAYRRVI